MDCCGLSLPTEAGEALEYLRAVGMYQVRGQFELTMDEKGRIALPARLREALDARDQSSLVLTYFDGAVQCYSLPVWEGLEGQLAGTSPFSASARPFLHGFVAQAQQVRLDKLGRAVVPGPLRRRAGLVRDVVLVSMLTWVELWDRASWEARLDEASESMLETGAAELVVGGRPT